MSTDDLLANWQSLTADATSDAMETGRALLASWAHPHRRYHDIAHLRDVLAHVEELAAHAADVNAVRLAAWYHDAVYRRRPDDEENSAQRAENELMAMGMPSALVTEVARLVRMTATHDPASGDRNGETLSDADLAVLAAPPERYAAYAAAVRDEYAHLDDDEFRAGRSKVLRALLDAPSLYRTPIACRDWEAQARANLRAELDSQSGCR